MRPRRLPRRAALALLGATAIAGLSLARSALAADATSTSASASASAPAAAPPPPQIALVLAELDLAGGRLRNPRNITPDGGMNFQPAFTPDGGALVYAAARDGINHVVRYDIATGQTRALTHDRINHYSPTPLADGSGFSAIRVVDADPAYGIESKQPSLWHFGWDGREIGPVVPTLRVGYHAWIDADRLALFLVDDVPERNAHRAVLMNRRTGQQTLLTDKPGRALGRTADSRRALFIDQTDPEHWFLCALGDGDAAPQKLVETPVGPEGSKDRNRPQYFATLPDGSVLMVRENLFLRWDGKPGSVFKPFAELPDLGGAVRNIAVSANGKRVVFAVVTTSR